MARDLLVAIEAAVYEAFGSLPTAQQLHRAIAERSTRYTTARPEPGDGRSGNVGGRGDLAARALFFTIADCAKIWLPLRECFGSRPPQQPLRVLDLGAGAGAMSLGFVAYLAAHGAASSVDLTLLDRDADALAVAQRAVGVLAKNLGQHVAVRAVTTDITVPAVAASAFDLIMMGTVLNELSPPVARRLLVQLRASLAPEGYLIAIEPATREATTQLHECRADLVAADYTIVGPCPHAAACPVLARDSWCHEEYPSPLPPRTHALAREMSLRQDGLKFSYLALGRAPREPRAAYYRIVERPHVQKGKTDFVLCGALGGVNTRLLKRNQSSNNRAIAVARRGDIVAISGEISRDIEASVAVQVVSTPRDLSREPNGAADS